MSFANAGSTAQPTLQSRQSTRKAKWSEGYYGNLHISLSFLTLFLCFLSTLNLMIPVYSAISVRPLAAMSLSPDSISRSNRSAIIAFWRFRSQLLFEIRQQIRGKSSMESYRHIGWTDATCHQRCKSKRPPSIVKSYFQNWGNMNSILPGKQLIWTFVHWNTAGRYFQSL